MDGNFTEEDVHMFMDTVCCGFKCTAIVYAALYEANKVHIRKLTAEAVISPLNKNIPFSHEEVDHLLGIKITTQLNIIAKEYPRAYLFEDIGPELIVPLEPEESFSYHCHCNKG